MWASERTNWLVPSARVNSARCGTSAVGVTDRLCVLVASRTTSATSSSGTVRPIMASFKCRRVSAWTWFTLQVARFCDSSCTTRRACSLTSIWVASGPLGNPVAAARTWASRSSPTGICTCCPYSLPHSSTSSDRRRADFFAGRDSRVACWARAIFCFALGA